jgi:hypothetical protein
MNGLHRPAQFIAAVGAGLALVAAFLPWVEARSDVAEFSITPATAEVIGGSVWVVVSALAVGMVLLVTKGWVTVVGCAISLYFTISLSFWLLTSRVSWLLPNRLIADDAPARLGVGATLALAGAVLGIVGCVVVLTEETLGVRSARLPRWAVPTSVTLVFACFAVRHVPWVRVSGGSFNWLVGFEAVPFIGDAMALMLLMSAVLLIVAVVRPRRWVSIAVGIGGLLVTLVCLLATAFTALIVRAADTVAGRVARVGDVEADVESTAGPLVTAGLGVALIVAAALMFRLFSSPASARDHTEPAPAVPEYTTPL